MYSEDLNIVICVGICTLSFYAINMDVVSLFADSSFLFLANLHCIDNCFTHPYNNEFSYYLMNIKYINCHIY